MRLKVSMHVDGPWWDAGEKGHGRTVEGFLWNTVWKRGGLVAVVETVKGTAVYCGGLRGVYLEPCPAVLVSEVVENFEGEGIGGEFGGGRVDESGDG